MKDILKIVIVIVGMVGMVGGIFGGATLGITGLAGLLMLCLHYTIGQPSITIVVAPFLISLGLLTLGVISTIVNSYICKDM